MLSVADYIFRAKYPLAIVNHQLDTLGEDQVIGYDIGCAFTSKVKSSKLVAPKVHDNGLRFSVNSFHGYAHSRLCQLDNHPLYLTGWGIEDLEGLERVFSASNAVTPSIRYAARYHRFQALDLHFRQWDDDKYLELSECDICLEMMFSEICLQVNFFSTTINNVWL
jgi:Kyakuja-Dileera-Zisupton transposase